MTEVYHSWQNFYLFAGGSAATLSGLVFVAISFSTRLVYTELRMSSIRPFINPVIVHFITVLLIALIMNIPTQTSGSLSLLLFCCGTVGIIHEFNTARLLWRIHHHNTRISTADWLWRVAAPVLGYLLIISVATAQLTSAAASFLNVLAMAVVLFLLVAIRNTWDLMLWIAKQE